MEVPGSTSVTTEWIGLLSAMSGSLITLIAKRLVDRYEDADSPDGCVRADRDCRAPWRRGSCGTPLLEALSVQVPERLGVELPEAPHRSRTRGSTSRAHS